MSKAELVKAVASDCGVSNAMAEKIVTSTFGNISAELSQGNDVNIAGFGSFGVAKVAGHEGINPKTKEKIWIAEKIRPTFKAYKALKDAVNK